MNITGEPPPFSHCLSFLAKKASIYTSFSEEQTDFIDKLEPMNIEARYPGNKAQLLQNLTNERCDEILKNAQELHKWIMQKL